eukprot:GFKZ01004590.1.p1 GENE.GFKZ01004590.1~~GFKZ01004590.1.p1  ORF type:complete len:114 (-),score=0.21 GFKZ01004590.1:294-635(-)
MSTTTGSASPPQPPPRTVRQEVAPKGGYAPINVARNVPKSISTRGAAWLLVGTAAMMSYSFYRLGTFNVKRRCVCRTFLRFKEPRPPMHAPCGDSDVPSVVSILLNFRLVRVS